MKRWVLFVTVLMMAAAVAAQPQRSGKRVADYLQLTPDQVTAWQQIHQDAAATMEPLQENARSLREQLRAALDAPSPDAAAVGALSIQLASVRKEMRAAHEDAKAKRMAVLTPDQKAKLEAFEAARESGRRHRREPN
jgi:Spy/CpxP family protein refolding chaperone